jgi:hypothetical protein
VSRKLSTAVSLLSLLLCAAALAACPISHWRSGRAIAWWGGPAGGPAAETWAVGATVDTGHTMILVALDVRSLRTSKSGIGGEADVREAGLIFSPRTYGWDSFRWHSVDGRPVADVRRYRLVAPLWAWAAAFALLPGWRARRWYRKRRGMSGPAFAVVQPAGTALAIGGAASPPPTTSIE